MFRTKVKICGVKTLEIAECAAEYGADAIGFVFYDKSPRNISVTDAAKIIYRLPAYLSKVGVFAGKTVAEISGIAARTGISVIQIHPRDNELNLRMVKELKEETGLPVVLAIRMENFAESDALDLKNNDNPVQNWINHYLIDRSDPDLPGGTGKQVSLGGFSDPSVKEFVRKKIILAGGLDPDNVQGILELIRPYAVDASSGLENEKGVKNRELVIKFLESVRSANS